MAKPIDPRHQELVDLISWSLDSQGVSYVIKRMFGGHCYMVDDKMCIGSLHDKKTDEVVILARVSPEVYEAALNEDRAVPMTFTGRAMKSFLRISEDRWREPELLEYWIEQCLLFNPHAKSSKKKSK